MPPARRAGRRSPKSSAGRCTEEEGFMSTATSYRLGIDIGGTFTDFCLMNETTGALMSVKVPSTPSHPTRSVLEGIKVYGDRYRVPAAAIRYFAHGTTHAGI